MPSPSLEATPPHPRAEIEPLEVVVREYPGSATSDVVGWLSEDAGIGLRAAVRRDGHLLLGHRVYIAPYVLLNASRLAGANPTWHGFFVGNRVAQPLLAFGVSDDVFACLASKGCSPATYWSAQVPDSLLRMSRDSVVVRLQGSLDAPEEFVIRRALIDPYLARVDSVVAARQRVAIREQSR